MFPRPMTSGNPNWAPGLLEDKGDDSNLTKNDFLEGMKTNVPRGGLHLCRSRSGRDSS